MKIIFIVLNFSALLSFMGCTPISGPTKLPEVKDHDMVSINPEKFTPEEWYAAYYLKHLSELANSIADTGKIRGFITLPVWRNLKDNKPYNARIMENIMSLAWFYTSDRPWNIFKGDPALRKRLEAALTFWCDIQNSDGRFSEYSPGQWSLAPTAFATKFIGRSLDLLKNDKSIDNTVFNRAKESIRKALYICFTDSALWMHGKNYTNQYSNLWGGALLYLKNWPDNEIENLFIKRFNESMTAFQSPCGYFYEKGGPDWGYNLNTHHSDLQVAWTFADKPWLKDSLLKQTQKWYEWFSYNAVAEPDTVFFFLNRGIETRQKKGFYVKNEAEDPANWRWTPQAEFIPIVRAFEISREEYAKSCEEKFRQVKNNWPRISPLDPGDFNAFSAYAFLHDGMDKWLPSKSQKDSAIRQLPYLAENRFTRIWHDNRSNTTYAFIRRPGYYAIFNSGKIISDQNRYGLGLIWSPTLGTIMQSQTGSSESAWGTIDRQHNSVFESKDLNARFIINGKELLPAEGRNNQEPVEIRIEYNLGNKEFKSLLFTDREIQVTVRQRGEIDEILPLLLNNKNLVSYAKTGIGIACKGNSLQIKILNASGIQSTNSKTDLKYKECNAFKISGKNKLEYIFTFGNEN